MISSGLLFLFKEWSWSIALAGLIVFIGALLYHHAIDPFNEESLGADGTLYLIVGGFVIFIVTAIVTMMTSNGITHRK